METKNSLYLEGFCYDHLSTLIQEISLNALYKKYSKKQKTEYDQFSWQQRSLLGEMKDKSNKLQPLSLFNYNIFCRKKGI